MIAFTIRQPWLWAIFHAGKCIENRTWPLPAQYRGKRVLAHASAGCTREEYECAAGTIYDISGLWPPPLVELPRGAICGALTFIGQTAPDLMCAPRMAGWHASTQHGWHIGDPYEMEKPIPCRGALGFWTVHHDIVQQIIGSLL